MFIILYVDRANSIQSYFPPFVLTRQKLNLMHLFAARLWPKRGGRLQGPGSEPATSDFSGDCEVCRCPPVLPSRAGCRHNFCYFCIKSGLVKSGGSFRCPACDQILTDEKLYQVVVKRSPKWDLQSTRWHRFVLPHLCKDASMQRCVNLNKCCQKMEKNIWYYLADSLSNLLMIK